MAPQPVETTSDSSVVVTTIASDAPKGNICQYIDASDGSVAAEREYSPFGQTVALTGDKKDEFSFWFSTKYEDAETGLYYYGYRYYSPELGRWPSRDPIGEADGGNLYVVVRNDPLNAIDIAGLKTRSCGGGLRLRVTISALDAHHPGQPYQDTAAQKVQVRNAQLTQAGLPGVQIPALQSCGEGIAKNAQNTFGSAYWLFFVDFDVCPDDANSMGFTIEETVTSAEECEFPATGGAPQCVPVLGLNIPTLSYPVGPQAQYGTVLAERNTPVSGCSHTAIFTDIATVRPQVFVAIAQNPKKFRRLTIRQKVKLVEYPAGSLWPAPPGFGGVAGTEIDAIEHTFSLGVNNDGTVHATP